LNPFLIELTLAWAWNDTLPLLHKPVTNGLFGLSFLLSVQVEFRLIAFKHGAKLQQALVNVRRNVDHFAAPFGLLEQQIHPHEDMLRQSDFVFAGNYFDA
jgi:hypothetical protein